MTPQLLWAIALGLFVMAVLFLTRFPYGWMVSSGVEPIRAVYYNRKIVHMVGSGLPTLAVPFVFESWVYPMVGGILLGVFIHLTHATGMRLYWFQTEENKNDVSFALMWWISLSFLWWLLGDPWLAILPALFMSFGDGVTGVVRNIWVRKRSKHPIGNLFMLAVCLPLAWVVGSVATPSIPVWSMLAAVAATVVERYEFGPIDDNVLIAVVSTAVLIVGAELGPLV